MSYHFPMSLCPWPCFLRLKRMPKAEENIQESHKGNGYSDEQFSTTVVGQYIKVVLADAPTSVIAFRGFT